MNNEICQSPNLRNITVTQTAAGDTRLVFPDNAWRSAGPTLAPTSRLILESKLTIGDVGMHVEAWEVQEADGQQAFACDKTGDREDYLYLAVGSGPFQTTTIGGKPYVVVITPMS